MVVANEDKQGGSVPGTAQLANESAGAEVSQLTALLGAIQALEVHRTPQRTLTALAHAATELLACTGADVLFRGEGRHEWQSLRGGSFAPGQDATEFPPDLLLDSEDGAQAPSPPRHGSAHLKARVLKVTRDGAQSESLCFRIDAARNSQERDPLSCLIALHRPPAMPFASSDITAAELLATHAALQLDVRSANAEIRQLETQLSTSHANEARWRNLARLTVDAATEEFDALSYSVSHDLRAPVRHVNSFVALLRKSAGDSLDDSARRYLDIVDQASQRLGQMVDGLLDLSRMNRAILSPVQLDLRPAVLELIDELMALHPARVINWRVNPLPQILADRELVRLAFRHLLTNAVKFTAPRATAEIEVGAEPGDGPFHRIYVRDNGVGFDPKYRQNLFRIFQRLHHASDFPGIGIGLACVRSIIQRHGGVVGADGTVGHGARFHVSLPKPAQ
jgi:signal transduction histidine kinase